MAFTERQPVTLVITVTLPFAATRTLTNIGDEASNYIAEQVGLAGFDADVTCLVGNATAQVKASHNASLNREDDR